MPRSSSERSAPTVVGPLAASAMSRLSMSSAFSAVICHSSAAGMKNSDHFDHTVPNENLADGYFQYEGKVRKNTLYLAPRGTSAGGGYSTVDDMLAFDQALRSNKLLKPETRDLLFSPQPERNSPSYGYGFMIVALGSDREVGHGGTFPGTTTYLSIYLDSGYTFVALCNGRGAQAAYNKALGLIERLKL